MARFLYHEKKKKFQNDRVFIMLYPDQAFIKSSDGELQDITWPEFFQTMGAIFDSSAAGKNTWENYFNPDPNGELEEQIPGQDNIMNHPEYLPGKLHGRKFEHCMYRPEEDCISEDCGSCEKKKLLDQQEAKEQKTEEKVKELKKPDPEEEEYLDAAARHLIWSFRDWMREDHMNRVTLVDKSPGELKRKLGPDGRTRWFATDKGTAHINMFDDYVQLWDEESRYMGDYDWFYLAAAIQSMWNVIALENAKKAREEAETGQGNAAREPELAPAQAEVIPVEGIDAKDIKTEKLSLDNLSIQINTDAWPEDLSDIPVPSELFIWEYLEEEEKMLSDYLECDGLPERTVLRQQLKVAGLRILRNLAKDVLETEEITQPELPRLKNNEERKEWLRNYKTWPLRHVDAYTGAKYYEYRFDNGAVLVAEEWKDQGNGYIPDHETVYLHLIGGPEAPRGQYGIRKWETHDRFNRFPDSETAMVEFLKAVQK